MRDRVAELTKLALADCSVLLGRPLTGDERTVVEHSVKLGDIVCTNVHTENVRLIARLAECLDGGDPPEMAVSA